MLGVPQSYLIEKMNDEKKFRFKIGVIPE